MEGPRINEIIEAWDDPGMRVSVIPANVISMDCPPNMCSDRYTFFVGLSDFQYIDRIGWAGTGSALTGGLLEFASYNLVHRAVNMIDLDSYTDVMGIEPGQGKPEREQRAYALVKSVLEQALDHRGR